MITIALLGASGTGKTTYLTHLTGNHNVDNIQLKIKDQGPFTIKFLESRECPSSNIPVSGAIVFITELSYQYAMNIILDWKSKYDDKPCIAVWSFSDDQSIRNHISEKCRTEEGRSYIIMHNIVPTELVSGLSGYNFVKPLTLIFDRLELEYVKWSFM